MGGDSRVTESGIWQAQPLAVPTLMSWYAIQTRPRHEKKVAIDLQEKGITTFPALVSRWRRWSDRRRLVQIPLFSSYVFVRIPYALDMRISVLRTGGVIGFVGARGTGVPIPDSQIEAVQTVLNQEVPFAPYPFLSVVQRVRIRGGSLEGIEGILVAKNGDRSLVVSVELIQRSLAIRVAGYEVEPIG